MATGKELVRLLTCGYWDDFVSKKYNICSTIIFDNNGKVITLDKAKTQTFCQLRIIIKEEMGEREQTLLGNFLKMIADTSGESMGIDINETYGFTEYIIS